MQDTEKPSVGQIMGVWDAMVTAAEARVRALRDQRGAVEAILANPELLHLIATYGGYVKAEDVQMEKIETDDEFFASGASSSGKPSQKAIARGIIEDNDLGAFQTKTVTKIANDLGYALSNVQVSNALSALVRDKFIVSTPEIGKGHWKRVHADSGNQNGPAEAEPFPVLPPLAPEAATG